MNTIIFVMPRLPFPATSGRKTSLYHYCRIIHNLGYRLVVAAFLEAGDNPGLKPNFIDRLVVLPNISAKEKMLNVVRDSFLKNSKPMQVGLFWSKNAKKVINQMIEEENPIAVISDMVRTTEYLKDSKCFKIADLDDMLSLRYERQFEADIEGINPYGAYLDAMPNVLKKIAINNRVKDFVLKHEINLLKKYELNIGRIFDRTVFVAENEAKKLNNKLGEEKAVAIPIGVDIDYYSEKVETYNNEEVYIGFLGAMNVAHNENAAIHFIEDILPIIIQQIPHVKFMIVGGGVTEKLKSFESENVFFTGRVEDVRLYIKSCRVFVCPLKFGSGIKTKNLEAMAMGVPVVTTSIGAENINAVDGLEWLIANNKEEFAEKVIQVVKNQEVYNSLQKQASKFIIKNFTWKVAEERFEQILSCITSVKEVI